MTILVRPSQDADLPSIHAIYSHAVINGTASWELQPPTFADMAARHAALLEAGFPFLVAEHDGRVAGYCYASAYRPRAAYKATVEDSIYIHPDAQGRGVGKALLGQLLEVCEAMGFRQMISIIGDGYGNSASSLKLHERFGFEVIGIARAVGFKHGRWLDQVLMQKSLGAGSDSPSPFA
jgi:L-amino acid N-acyltransferase YncA